MSSSFNRRQVLIAGVAGAASIAADRAVASSRTVAGAPSSPGRHTVLPAAVAFAALDPRFIGPAARCSQMTPASVASASLRRVPAGQREDRIADHSAGRVRLLGCCAAAPQLQGLCVELLQPVGADATRRTLRRCVLAADLTGAVAPSTFTHPAPSITLIVRSRGIERSATLSRRGVYAIALDRRAPLWHSLRLASIPAGEGFTLTLLAHDQPCDVPCLLVAID